VEPELRKALKQVNAKRAQVTETTGEGVKKALGYLPLVTKRDFAELVKRIDGLAGKVESLRKRK
jgi:hypothetical protein